MRYKYTYTQTHEIIMKKKNHRVVYKLTDGMNKIARPKPNLNKNIRKRIEQKNIQYYAKNV